MAAVSDGRVNILFIADIVGQVGVDMVGRMLKTYIDKYKVDFVIVNGENSLEGKGISEEIVRKLYSFGAHVITSGNHIWDKWKIHDYLPRDPNLLRPANYPKGTPGFGSGVYNLPGGKGKIGVINLQGRTFMQAIDDPFRTAETIIEKMRQETRIIFVDMHAEATAEKMSLAWHLDGKISALVGTHTHVQTADERILPGGTAYLTDAGMTGPYDSVIGMNKAVSIRRFLYQTPQKYEIAHGDVHLAGVFVGVNRTSGKAEKIERIFFPSF